MKAIKKNSKLRKHPIDEEFSNLHINIKTQLVQTEIEAEEDYMQFAIKI